MPNPTQNARSLINLLAHKINMISPREIFVNHYSLVSIHTKATGITTQNLQRSSSSVDSSIWLNRCITNLLIHWWYFRFFGFVIFFGIIFVFKGFPEFQDVPRWFRACSLLVLQILMNVSVDWYWEPKTRLLCGEAGRVTRQVRIRRTNARRFFRAVHPIFCFALFCFLIFFLFKEFQSLISIIKVYTRVFLSEDGHQITIKYNFLVKSN